MQNNYPTGKLTFLFTDVEGSTRLWEQQPAAMQAALARHDHLLRGVIEAHGGRVVKTTGDGLYAVFTMAAESVSATLACQQGLLGEAWDGLPQPLRARMGLHTGEAEYRDGDYFGPAVNRAARLMAIAAGGQILLSAATAELVRERMPQGAALQDLGEHRLKDLIHPEHVYQLNSPDLPFDFPPLRSLNTLPNNLPLQLTSFIGREHEIAEVKHLLAETRLLTLTGPGGTGKTRLSLQAAAEVLEDFRDGAWLVELAPVSDPGLIPQAIAAVWGVREQPGRPLVDALIDYLRAKLLLLVLDNCEHLIDACAQLVKLLLSACPGLKILSSSREALGVAGETSYRVPSLTLPGADHSTEQTLLHSEAARLFVERARAAQPHFALAPQNLSAVAQICRRLDGIPLALELAAARLKLFSAEQIAARLDDRFRLLTGGSRTALPRQQTLRALIDWSYDLLPEADRAALRWLSVFAGGWTFEAAEAVIGLDALDLLGHLVDRSLVVVEEEDGETRYRLLETIRQYGREKLFDANEAGQARDRHLSYFLALAEKEEPGLYGSEMTEGLDRLEVEQDNLRAALEWALENDALAALRLATALYVFWARRASVIEGLNWIRDALAQVDAALARSEALRAMDVEAQPAYQNARAMGLARQAALLLEMGNNQAAQTAVIASISVARPLNAYYTLAIALAVGITASGFLGEAATARAWADECLTLCREHGFVDILGLIAGVQLFISLFSQEPLPASVRDEYLRTARASGNPWAIALAVQNIGRLARATGDLTEASARFEESAALYRQMRDRPFYNGSRSELGHVLRTQGRYPEASAIYRETILVWQELGFRAAVAHELECFAFIACAQAQAQRAARLFGAAEGLRESNNTPMISLERVEYDQSVSELRAQMEDAAFAKAWAEGRVLTMEAAIAAAIE